MGARASKRQTSRAGDRRKLTHKRGIHEMNDQVIKQNIKQLKQLKELDPDPKRAGEMIALHYVNKRDSRRCSASEHIT